MAENADRLNEWFGLASFPTYIRPLERTQFLSAIYELKTEFSVELAQLVKLSGSNNLAGAISESVCFLWVVTEDGRVLLCLEEVCQLSHAQSRFLRTRGLPLSSELATLGHPLLVGLGEARIAGELFCQSTPGGRIWTINGKSGRYSGALGKKIGLPKDWGSCLSVGRRGCFC